MRSTGTQALLAAILLASALAALGGTARIEEGAADWEPQVNRYETTDPTARLEALRELNREPVAIERFEPGPQEIILDRKRHDVRQRKARKAEPTPLP